MIVWVDAPPAGTPEGFRWGPLTVERWAAWTDSAGRWRVLRVRSGVAGQDLHIYISPDSRSVRVFRDNEELTVDDCQRARGDPAVRDHSGPP